MAEPPPIYPGQVDQFSLPNTISDQPPPPSYEQVFGPTAKKETISTGPTEYVVCEELSSSIFFVFLAQLIMKFALGIALMTKGCFFCVTFGIVYCVSFINVWFFYLAVYECNMTLVRYKLKRLIYAPCFYCFLLDYVIYLGIPGLGILLQLEMNFQITAGIVMALVNSITFFVIVRQETMDYKPFCDSEKFIPVNTHEESAPDNQLSITEWGPFKIVIANIGDKPVVGALTVIRSVYSERIDRHNQILRDKEDVKLKLFLSTKFEPGTDITLIPETHTLAGAFQMKDFRAFGRDRDVLVEVAIYMSEEEDAPYCVKRSQAFSKRI